MNKLYTYNNFINEGVRDMMTPKSEEDIENSLKDISLYRAGKLYNNMLIRTAGKVSENVMKHLPLIFKCHQDVYFNPKVEVEKYLREGWKSNDYKKQTEPEEMLKLFFEVTVKKNNKKILVSQHKNNKYLYCSFINPATNKLDITTLRTVMDFRKILDDVGLLNESLRDKMTPKSKDEISEILKDKSPQEIFQTAVKLDDIEMLELAFEESSKKNINIALLYPERLSMLSGDKFDMIRVILKHQPNSIYGLVNSAASDGFSSKIKTILDLVDSPKHELLDKLLLYSCTTNLSNAVKILVEEGANVHMDREEPLMQAVYSGHMLVVKELLKLGADPTIDDNRPIREAHRRRYFDIEGLMKLYVRKTPLKKRLSRYIPFLGESIRDKMTPKSKEEVEESIGDLTPNAKLVKAAEFGAEWVVKKALSEGADVHHQNDLALREAGENNHVDIVRLLLKHGADVHIGKDIVLKEAAWSVRHELIEVLLEYGADIHVENDYVLSSVVEAVVATRMKDLRTITLLLEHGAIPKTNDVRFATAHSRLDVVNLLKRYM